MRKFRLIFVLALVAAACASAANARAADVAKTNPMKVYMHYMPWFDAPTTPGGTNWGIHWKMSTQNPNIVDATGKRQIASHFYPLIGPYESSDPDVIEYHMLLMKYAGVDGVMIDWYGVQGTNGDVGSLLENSNALVDKTDDFGMKFSVVLEDNFAGSLTNGLPNGSNSQAVNNVTLNMQYLAANYFNKPNYLKAGASNAPLMPIFGPSKIQPVSGNSNINSAALWSQIFSQSGTNPTFMPLEYQSSDAGTNADGEYAWPYQDNGTSNHITGHLRPFYTGQAGSLKVAGKTVGGVAYPGFDDFYQEGGWGPNLFEIPANNGQTLQQTLDLANQYSSRIDFLQLVTWNDFGEGTMIEPTVETGFSYLKQIQQFTGVSYGEAELQLIYRLYMARKEYAGNAPIDDAMLDQVSQLLVGLQVDQATALLNSAAPVGDYNGDGQVDAADYQVWRNSFGSSTISHGSGADGNYDGKIDAADFTIWRDSQAVGGSGANGIAIPEPSALALSLLGGAAIIWCMPICRIRACGT